MRHQITIFFTLFCGGKKKIPYFCMRENSECGLWKQKSDGKDSFAPKYEREIKKRIQKKMKKRNILFMLALLLHVSTWSQSVTLQGFIYTVTGDGTASVTGASGNLIGTKTVASQVTISGSQYQVTAIRSQAFLGQKYLRKITLPAELDTLGMEAFLGCLALQEIEGIEKVKVIEDYAFINLPIKTIDISGWGVESLGHGVFANCTSLTEAKLPTDLKILPERIFSGCTSLTTTNLSEMTALKTIGAGAFAGCSSLTELTLPATLTTIGELAFDGMTGLQSLTFPDVLTTIGDYAFRNCTGLTELSLPLAFTTLGFSPFYGCSSLKKVVLPYRLKTITDNYVFDHCLALEEIEISTLNSLYKTEDGVLYNRAKTQIISWPAALSKTKHPVLPIYSYPLAKGALMDCEMDEEVWLPERMATIPRDALTRTKGMKCLTVGDESRLTGIDMQAVEGSEDLEVIDLPASLKSVGESAFMFCPKVSDVIVRTSTPPSLSVTSFDVGVFAQAMLHVPVGSSETYREATGWSLFQSVEDDALTTGIEQPLAEVKETGEMEIYDLSGRRMNVSASGKQGLRKGLYIINGKKEIVR